MSGVPALGRCQVVLAEAVSGGRIYAHSKCVKIVDLSGRPWTPHALEMLETSMALHLASETIDAKRTHL